MQIKGVDLSTHNKIKDYATLKAAGVEFAILRTGYGSDYPGQQDALFEKHLAGCESIGIPWGAYHYGYARDKQGGIDEAKHCLRILAGRKPAYGVWYDMEDKRILGGDLARAAEGFCSTMEAAGLYVGVYSGTSWFTDVLTDPIFDKYDKWVADWADHCTLNKPYGIWQYSEDLYIDGVRMDGDFAYKDYPSLTGGRSTVNTKSRVLATQENHITNPFGNGHSGVDLGWQTTQIDGILAHSEGKVVFCQTGHSNNKGSTGNASYGNCVKLQHPNGYYTLYAHLSEVNVSYGQTVGKGQQIGRMGNTGNSYGNHLHFEVRNHQNTCIDPAPYIAADLPGLVTEKEDEEMLTYEQFKQYMARYEQELAAAPTPAWGVQALEYAQQRGIINGDGNGNVRPMSHVTRMELAQVLYNQAKAGEPS